MTKLCFKIKNVRPFKHFLSIALDLQLFIFCDIDIFKLFGCYNIFYFKNSNHHTIGKKNKLITNYKRNKCTTKCKSKGNIQ